jgi:glycosyltransferase involved in cell wall biosynthesis
VDSLLSDSELIKQMLPKARQLVEEKYSLKQMIANYQKFYLAIMKK